MENQPNQYVVVSRMLHWILAAMVLTMLCIGVAMVTSVANYHLFVVDPPSAGNRDFVPGRRPAREPARESASSFSADDRTYGASGGQASEYTLYALMFVQPVVGWGMLSAARSPVVLYGSLHLPFILPHNAKLYAVLREAHTVPGLLLFPHIPCSLWCDSVSHVDP